MATPIGALFLDSCILLNKILGEDPHRTSKLFEDMESKNVLCFLSSSVDQECNDKITNTINFIGGTLRDFFKGALNYNLQKQGRNLDNIFEHKDLMIIEEIFMYLYNSDALKGPSRSLEEHMVEVVENKINSGEIFSFNQLILEITSEIIRLTNTLQDNYENIFLLVNPSVHIYLESPDQVTIEQIAKLHNDIHYPDTVHLASVIKYQQLENKKAVFVSTDYGIINHKYMLHNKFGLYCSDPLYAIHNF